MLASFEYDAMGRRTRKTVGTAVTQYLYDGANAVQELTVANTVSANVLGGLAMDQWYLRSEGATTRHFLTDALGSTRALSDDAAAIRTRYQYEPYGESRTTGDASTNSSQYTGRENDGTGLYYYRARYYHPAVKRFISEDPIGLSGGDNIYLYGGGNPIDFVDPDGMRNIMRPGPQPMPRLQNTPSGAGNLNARLESYGNQGDGAATLTGAGEQFRHPSVPNAVESLVNPLRSGPFVPTTPVGAVCTRVCAQSAPGQCSANGGCSVVCGPMFSPR